MSLCNYKTSSYKPPYSYGTGKSKTFEKYSKMSSYGKGYDLTSEYKESEIQPNTFTKNNYCKTNNLCQNSETYTFLNKRGVESSPYFTKSYNCGYKSTRQDSRLVDTSRNVTMNLDVPPIQVAYDVKHDNMDGKRIGQGKTYGKHYDSYADVNAGQIQYYVDSEIAQPFFSPVYAMQSEVDKTMYIDPMGTKKPQFTKKFNEKRQEHTNMLSSIEDTTKHREDIMSLQQRVHNERRYDLVYKKM
jgi:hypothetical protein